MKILKSDTFSGYLPENLKGILYPFLWGQIPSEQLTRLRSSAIILRYKGGQDQADTPKFKQAIFVLKRDELSNLTLQYQYFSQLIFNFLSMYDFDLKGDLGRHHLSISGAVAECGISTSTIHREAGKTFPPKRQLSTSRIGFQVFQIEEWLNGKRGGWQ